MSKCMYHNAKAQIIIVSLTIAGIILTYDLVLKFIVKNGSMNLNSNIHIMISLLCVLISLFNAYRQNK